jgi:hypothetical protein
MSKHFAVRDRQLQRENLEYGGSVYVRASDGAR